MADEYQEIDPMTGLTGPAPFQADPKVSRRQASQPVAPNGDQFVQTLGEGTRSFTDHWKPGMFGGSWESEILAGHGIKMSADKTEEDYQQELYDKQGLWDRTGNMFGQLALKIPIFIAEGVMQIVPNFATKSDDEVNSLLKIGALEEAYNNGLRTVTMNALGKMRENIDAGLPQRQKPGSDGGPEFSAGFMFTAAEGTLESVGGVMGQMALMTGAAGLVGKGINALTGNAGAMAFNSLRPAFQQVAKEVGAGVTMNFIEGGTMAHGLYNNVMREMTPELKAYDEQMKMEAGARVDELMKVADNYTPEELQSMIKDINKDADEALQKRFREVSDNAAKAATTFRLANASNLWADMIQVRGVFSGKNMLAGMIEKPTKGFYEGAQKIGRNLTKLSADNALLQAGKEGVEEITQNVMQNEGEFMGQRWSGVEHPVVNGVAQSGESSDLLNPRTYSKSLLGRMSKYATSPQALTEGLMGALGGYPQHVVSKIIGKGYGAKAKQREQEAYDSQQDLIKINKDYFENKMDSYQQSQDMLKEAVASGNSDMETVVQHMTLLPLIAENLQKGTIENFENLLADVSSGSGEKAAQAREISKEVQRMKKAWVANSGRPNSQELFLLDETIHIIKKYAEPSSIKLKQAVSKLSDVVNSTLEGSLLTDDKKVTVNNLFVELHEDIMAEKGKLENSVHYGWKDLSTRVEEILSWLPDTSGDLVEQSQEYQEFLQANQNFDEIREQASELKYTLRKKSSHAYQNGVLQMQTILEAGEKATSESAIKKQIAKLSKLGNKERYDYRAFEDLKSMISQAQTKLETRLAGVKSGTINKKAQRTAATKAKKNSKNNTATPAATATPASTVTKASTPFSAAQPAQTGQPAPRAVNTQTTPGTQTPAGTAAPVAPVVNPVVEPVTPDEAAGDIHAMFAADAELNTMFDGFAEISGITEDIDPGETVAQPVPPSAEDRQLAAWKMMSAIMDHLIKRDGSVSLSDIMIQAETYYKSKYGEQRGVEIAQELFPSFKSSYLAKTVDKDRAAIKETSQQLGELGWKQYSEILTATKDEEQELETQERLAAGIVNGQVMGPEYEGALLEQEANLRSVIEAADSGDPQSENSTVAYDYKRVSKGSVIMAYLARTYATIKEGFSFKREEHTNEMRNSISRELMDISKFRPGTEISFNVKDDDTADIYDPGTDGKVTIKWGEYKNRLRDTYKGQDITQLREYKENVPIQILGPEGNAVAAVHASSWIKAENVAGTTDQVKEDRAKNLNLRSHILAEKSKGNTVKTKVTSKSIGYLFKTVGGEKKSVFDLMPDENLILAVGKGDRLALGSGQDKFFDGQLLNTEIKNGWSYVVVPVGFNDETKQPIYAAIAITNTKLADSKLGRTIAYSIRAAMACYLSKTDINGFAKAIREKSKIDILTQKGIAQYMEMFINNYNIGNSDVLMRSNGLGQASKIGYLNTDGGGASIGSDIPVVVMKNGNLEFSRGMGFDHKFASHNTSDEHNEKTLDALFVKVNKVTNGVTTSVPEGFLVSESHVGVRFAMNTAHVSENTPVVLMTLEDKPTMMPYRELATRMTTTNVVGSNVGTEEKKVWSYTLQPVITFEDPAEAATTVVPSSAKPVAGQSLTEVNVVGKETEQSSEPATTQIEYEDEGEFNAGSDNNSATITEDIPDYTDQNSQEMAQNTGTYLIKALGARKQMAVTGMMMNEVLNRLFKSGKKAINATAIFDEYKAKFTELHAKMLRNIEAATKNEDWGSVDKFTLKAATYKELLDNWAQLVTLTEGSLSKLGNAHLDSKPSEEAHNFKLTTKRQKLAELNSEDSEEKAESQRTEQNDWSEYSEFSYDAKDSAGVLVKRMLTTVKAYKEDGSPKLNYLGIQELKPFDEVFNTLQKVLEGLPSDYIVMRDFLKNEMAVHHPWAADVVALLESGDTQLRNQFVHAMTGHFMSLRFIMWSTDKSGKYVLRDTASNAFAEGAALKSNWTDNLMSKEFVIEPLDNPGSAVYSADGRVAIEATYQRMVDAYKGTDKKLPSREDVSEYLNLFGIELSPNTLDALMDGRFIRGNQPQSLSFMLTNNNGLFFILNQNVKNRSASTLEDNNPITKEKVVGDLALFASRFTDQVASNSHRVRGKTIQTFSRNRLISTQTQEFRRLNKSRNVKTKEEVFTNTLTTNLYDKTMFNRHSTWLQDMFLKDADGKPIKAENGEYIIATKGTGFSNFYYWVNSIEPVKNIDMPNKKDNDLPTLPEADIEFIKIAYLQSPSADQSGNNNRVIRLFFPTTSDKKTVVGLQVPAFMFDVTPEGALTENALENLYKVMVLPEIERIVQYQAALKAGHANQTYNIDGYAAMASKFHFIPELNNMNELFTEDGMLSDEAQSTEMKTKIKEVLARHINTLVDQKSAEWDTFGIGKSDKKTKNAFIDKEFLEDNKTVASVEESKKIRMAAQDMVVQYLVGNANAYMMYIGDPATYAKVKGGRTATEHAVIKRLIESKRFDAVEIAQMTSEELYRQHFTPTDRITEMQDLFTNVGKRLAADIAPRNEIADSQKETYTQAIVEDYSVDSSQLAAYKARLSPGLAKKYAGITSTDGQEFVSWQEALHIMRKQGKLSDAEFASATRILTEQERQLDKQGFVNENAEDLSAELQHIIFQPSKPVSAGNIFSNGIYKRFYIKSSATALLPKLVQGLELDNLRIAMKNQGVQRVAFMSAIKVGGPRNPTTIFNANGSIKNPKEIDFSGTVMTLPRKYFGIQQEVPYHALEHEINRVTQASKNLFVNLLRVKGFKIPGQTKEYTGEELENEYFKYYDELFKLHQREFLAEILDADGQPDVNKIKTIIQDEAEMRGYPLPELEMLGLNEYIDTIAFSPSADKFESLLNSIVDNRIRKSKMFGDSWVTTTDAGYTTKIIASDTTDGAAELAKITGIIHTQNYKGGVLQPQRQDPATGKILPAQILVSWNFHDKEGNLLDVKNFMSNGKIDPAKLPSDILTALMMRIPNQGLNSHVWAEIVGFLPNQSGNTIIGPSDLVTQTGMDFDIDKLYAYMYNRTHNFDSETGQHSFTRSTKPGKETLQNNIMDVHMAIMQNSDPAVQNQVANPLGEWILVDKAGQFQTLRGARGTEPGTVAEVPFFSGLSDSYQRTKFLNAVAGKDGISVFSLDNVFNALAQRVDGLRVIVDPKETIDKLRYLHTSFGSVSSKGFLNRERTLGASEHADGEYYISDVIAGYQSASVDNEKLQILGLLHINQYTFKTVKLMNQLGFGEETLNFIQQDILIDYVKRLAQLSSTVSGFTPDKVGQAMRDLIEDPKSKYYNKEYVEADFLQRTLMLQGKAEGELSNTRMIDMITNGEASADYVLTQIAILEKFQMLDEYGKQLQHVQVAVNVDSKGMGKSIIESILKQEKAESLFGSTTVENAGKLLGTAYNLAIQEQRDAYNALTPDEQNSFVDLSEVDEMNTTGIRFKPETLNGQAIAYALTTNNRLWSDLFPYKHPAIQQIFTEFSRVIGIDNESTTAELEQRTELWNSMKSYLFASSSMHLFTDDAGAERRRLFFRYSSNGAPIVSNVNLTPEQKAMVANGNSIEVWKNKQGTDWIGLKVEGASGVFVVDGKIFNITRKEQQMSENGVAEDRFTITPAPDVYLHKPLGQLVMALKKTEYGKNNPFISMLEVKDGNQGYPTMIKTQAAPKDAAFSNDTFNAFTDMILNPVDLGVEFNGVAYDTRRLAQELIAGIYLSGGIQEAVQFVKYIPQSYLMSMGFLSNLNSLFQNKSTIDSLGIFKMPAEGSKYWEVSQFVTQYIQHNATDVKFKLSDHDVSRTEKDSYGNSVKRSNLYDVDNANPMLMTRFKLSVQALKDHKVSETVYPIFVTLYNPQGVKGNKALLFKYNGEEYVRLETLGAFGMKEYNSALPATVPAVSNIAQNKVGMTYSTAPAKTTFEAPKVNPSAEKIPISKEEYLAEAGFVNSIDGNAQLIKIVQEIATSSSDASLKALAIKILPNLSSLKPGLKLEIVKDYRSSGSYHSDNHQMVINTTKLGETKSVRDVQKTLLHEVIHALTKTSIVNYMAFLESKAPGKTLEQFNLTETQATAVQGIINVMNQARNVISNDAELSKAFAKFAQTLNEYSVIKETDTQAAKELIAQMDPESVKKFYGIQNIQEFATMVLTDPTFREFLNTITIPGTTTTLWEKVKEAFTDLMESFGMNIRHNSALAEGLTHSINLFGTYSVNNDDAVHVWHSSGKNANLSNLAIRPFFGKDGKKYFSVEHYYQTWKSGAFDETTYKGDWSKAGTKISGKTVNKADGYNIKMMKEAMRMSFEANSSAIEELLETGDKKITHGGNDAFWSREFSRILMELRSEFAQKKVAPSNEIAHHMPMNFTDGTGGRKMRPEFAGASTMDLILSGDRTATSRSRQAQKDVRVGELIKFEDQYGRVAMVRATSDSYPVENVTAEEWSKLEGWDAEGYNRIKGDGYTQFQFELVGNPIKTIKPFAAEKAKKDIYPKGSVVTYQGKPYVVSGRSDVNGDYFLMSLDNNSEKKDWVKGSDLSFANDHQSTVVDYRGSSYTVVASRENGIKIFSSKTDRLMAWDENNGDRKAILAIASAELGPMTHEGIKNLDNPIANSFEFADGIKIDTENIALNPEQKVALQAMADFYTNHKQVGFSLTGYAGTGKSTIVKFLLQYVKLYEAKRGVPSIILAAPTHRAAKVLRRMIRRAKGIGFMAGKDVNTVASLLSKQLVDKQWISGGSKKFVSGSLIIVDEGSMVNTEDADTIIRTAAQKGCQVIFMGDPAQIPPPGKFDNSLSSALSQSQSANLTKIERQTDGNPILEIATTIRQNLLKIADQFAHTTTINSKGEGVEFLNTQVKFIDRIRELFTSKEYAENKSYAKIIAYTNRAVQDYNSQVRAMLLEDKGRIPYQVGETIMGYDQVTDQSQISNGQDYQVVESTFETERPVKVAGQVFKAVGYSLRMIETDMEAGDNVEEFRVFIPTTSPGVNTELFKAIHELSLKAYDKKVDWRLRESFKNTLDDTLRVLQLPESIYGYKNEVKPMSAWRVSNAELFKADANGETEFDRLIFSGAATETKKNIDYGYAVTSHKAQGSEFQYALVDWKDMESKNNLKMKKWKGADWSYERQNLKYTAISRARKVAILYSGGARVTEENSYMSSGMENGPNDVAVDWSDADIEKAGWVPEGGPTVQYDISDSAVEELMKHCKR